MIKAERYVIGLGSNLGEPFEQLQRAVSALESLGRVERVSRVFRTAPLGPPQPHYLNAAALLVAALAPPELLNQLLAIERAQGRVRTVRWGPRTIDLDILWWSGGICQLPELEVPHPGLPERPFALLPLIDVEPDAVDPKSGRSYSVIWRDLQQLSPPAVERGLHFGNTEGSNL